MSGMLSSMKNLRILNTVIAKVKNGENVYPSITGNSSKIALAFAILWSEGEPLGTWKASDKQIEAKTQL